MSPLRLGDFLVQRGLIDKSQLASALLLQRRTGERLGRLLLTLDMVKRIDLTRTLAELWGFPFVTVDSESINPVFAEKFPLVDTVRFRAVPLHDDGERLIIALADAPSDQLIAALHGCYGQRELDFRITTEWDIDRGIAFVHRHQVADASIYGLYFRSADESAFRAITEKEVAVVGTLVCLAGIGMFYRPAMLLLIIALLVTVFLAALTCLRWWPLLAPEKFESAPEIGEEEADAHNERELPIYSVLVPVKSEGIHLDTLLRSLRQLDYPADKLDIILLFDETDSETLGRVKATTPGANIRFLIVPTGEPDTRARACNIGLLFARGEYLVCYAPRDQPDVVQLKMAALAFARGRKNLVCVQAAREYFGRRHSPYSGWLALQPASWFHFLMPALTRLQLPIPLGGTSNHFRTRELGALGGWDPFNVSDDADLGVRAAAHGYQASVIDTTTWCETGHTLADWWNERWRWVRGHGQAALVYWRNPQSSIREVGMMKWLGNSILLLATPMMLLSPPLSLLVLVLCLSTHWGGGVLLALSASNFAAGMLLAVWVNLFAARRRKVSLGPGYWGLVRAGEADEQLSPVGGGEANY